MASPPLFKPPSNQAQTPAPDPQAGFQNRVFVEKNYMVVVWSTHDDQWCYRASFYRTGMEFRHIIGEGKRTTYYAACTEGDQAVAAHKAKLLQAENPSKGVTG